MKRRHFIYTSLLSGIAMNSFGYGILNDIAFDVSDDELIGNSDMYFIDTTIKLRREAYTEFKAMQKAALKDGINISVVSAYRSYNDQKGIWDRKYKSYISKGLTHKDTVKKIIEYSTIPGTSRHHWGTDIDIIDTSVLAPKNVLSTPHFEGNGVYCSLKNWMDKNAKNFNFHLVYTDNPKRKGFKYEPWHYSYKPLSKLYLKAYKERNLIRSISNTNFEGSEKLSKNFIEQYYTENILDINPVLL